LGQNPTRFRALTLPAGNAPALAPGSLHLYRAVLDDHGARTDGLVRLLSPEETDRACRFRFPEHRRRYVVAHGILREILSRYLTCAPEAVRFSTGPNGKPCLCSPDPSIRFNMSHSDRLALYAVSLDCEVGVDTEPLRTLPDAGRLMADYFPHEMNGMSRDDSDEAVSHRFLRCWTRHEAVLKLSGAGLTGERRTGYPEYVDSFIPAAGHIAAVASARPLPNCRFIDFRSSLQ
jgi:4'-phosphopantetheinyl transferase